MGVRSGGARRVESRVTHDSGLFNRVNSCGPVVPREPETVVAIQNTARFESWLCQVLSIWPVQVS